MNNRIQTNKNPWQWSMLLVCALGILFAAENAFAAARYGGAGRRDERLREEDDAPAPRARGTITSPSPQIEETTRLGMYLRSLSEDQGIVGFVLMNGLEDVRIDPPSLRRTTASRVAERIAEIARCRVQETEHYRFLYPEGFEALTQIQLPSLDPVYDEIEAEIAFGANLPLFMVFAWLSQATETTIIADNLAAAAFSGELSLGEVPLRTGLEAIMKSARAIGVGVDSTPEYVFFYHPGRNPYATKRTLLINADDLPTAQQSLLERRVNVILPTAPGTPGPVPYQAGAQPLSRAVQSFSRQIGVPIVIDRALADLPVNPAAFTNARLGTVLDLLIRQWIYPDIGYEVQEDRIVIRRLAAPRVASRDAAPDMHRALVGNEAVAPAEPVEQVESMESAEPPVHVYDETPISPEAAKTVAPVPPEPVAEAPAAPIESPAVETEETVDAPAEPREPAVAPERAPAQVPDVQTAEVLALAEQLAEQRAAAEAAAQQAAQLKAEAEAALALLAEERKAAEEAIRRAQEDRAAAERAAAEAQRAAEEKAAAEKAAEEQAAAEAEAQRAAEEQAAAEKAAAEAEEAEAQNDTEEEAATDAEDETAEPEAAEEQAAAEPEPENPPTLKARLDAFKAEFAETAAPEVVQAFQEGIDEVAQSGILDKAKKVGEQAPLFELPDAAGASIKLEDQLKQGPVVLVWFRGGWCPYCNLQLQALQESLSQISEQGARVLAISPQKPEHSQKTAEEGKLGFSVLTDADNAVAKQYGLASTVPETVAKHLAEHVDLETYNAGAANELPLSATYVVGTEGVIRYAFVNADYRQRAEPADIVSALRQLKADAEKAAAEKAAAEAEAQKAAEEQAAAERAAAEAEAQKAAEEAARKAEEEKAAAEAERAAEEKAAADAEAEEPEGEEASEEEPSGDEAAAEEEADTSPEG